VRILVAGDNPVSPGVLRAMLANWDYEVVVVSGGEEAWSALQSADGPRLAASSEDLVTALETGADDYVT